MKKNVSKTWALIIILIVASGTVVGFSVIYRAKVSKKLAPVGSILYLWYGNQNPGTSIGGVGSSGWNSSLGTGAGAVVDRPVIGYYESNNDTTFAWQIGQMQIAGLSFAVVSWWGAEGGNEAINNATIQLFQYLKDSNSSFKLAIMVDAYLQPSEQNTQAYKSIYNTIYDQFVKPYGNWYFTFEGKPLLLFFNPMYPSYVNSTFTVKTIGNRPNPVQWTFWDAPTQYFNSQAGTGINAQNDQGNPVISKDGEVTIIPRIDSYYNYKYGYQGGYMRFDPTLSQGLYQSEWNYVLSKSSSVRLVIIYSWNEYHERSAIEPHNDFTYSGSPYHLLNLTTTFVSELNRAR